MTARKLPNDYRAIATCKSMSKMYMYESFMKVTAFLQTMPITDLITTTTLLLITDTVRKVTQVLH